MGDDENGKASQCLPGSCGEETETLYLSPASASHSPASANQGEQLHLSLYIEELGSEPGLASSFVLSKAHNGQDITFLGYQQI